MLVKEALEGVIDVLLAEFKANHVKKSSSSASSSSASASSSTAENKKRS